MPVTIPANRKNHLGEAQRNYTRYTNLVDSDPDLALNCLFWCALHLVQAQAVHANTRDSSIRIPKDHTERTDYISDNISSILAAYGMLKDACQDARYNLVRFTSNEVRERHDREFARIHETLERRGIKL